VILSGGGRGWWGGVVWGGGVAPAGGAAPPPPGPGSSAALSLRDTKPSSSLRSEEESFDQTGPDRTEAVSPGAGAGSRAGRGGAGS